MAFPWEQVIKSGVAIAGNLQARSKTTGAEKAQAGAEFDAYTRTVAAEFHRIQLQPVITTADAQAAEALFQRLQAISDQIGDEVPYIREQWESSAYKPAFENGLRVINSRVIETADSYTTATGAQSSALSGISNAQLLLIGLAAFVGIKLLKG